MINRKFFHGFGVVMTAGTVVVLLLYLADGRRKGGVGLGPIIGIALILALAWMQFRAFAKDARRPLPKDFDSDGGIDWQEKGVGVQMLPQSGSMVLLVPDSAVHETDTLSERFAEKGIRFKVETISRGNPGYSHYGRGGLSTRMRIWVHEADLAAAKPIVDEVLKIVP